MKELLSLCVRVLLTPARILGRWLTPSVGREPRIERLQWWRTAIGYAGFVALLAFRGSAVDGDSILNGAVVAPVVKAAIAIPCFVVAVVVLAARRHTGSRTAFVRQASGAWITAVLAVVVPVVVLGAIAWFLMPDVTANKASLPWIYLLLFFSAPLLMAAFWAMVVAVRFSFRASDVHPFMPAVVGAVIASTTAVYGVFETLDAVTEIERWLGVAGIVGCCVSGVLSAYEFELMRSLGATWSSSYVRPPRQYRGAIPLALFVILPLLTVIPVRTGLRNVTAGVQAQLAERTAPARSKIEGTARRPSTGRGSASTTAQKSRSVRTKASATQPRSVRVEPIDVTVSSQAPDGTDSSDQIVSYGPENLVDGDPSTAWRTPGNAVGETITLSLPQRTRIRSVGLVPGYTKVDAKDGTDRFTENGRVATVVWTGDSGRASPQEFADSRKLQRMDVDITTSVITVRITGSKRGPRPFTAISDIVIFGSAVGG